MKKIKLTKNEYALVDDDVFEELNKNKWYCGSSGYAVRNKTTGGNKQTKVYMHSFIMGTKKGMDTDHIDGNKLNNQRSNLRICTHSQNKMNQGKTKTNKSGFKGVIAFRKKWRAHIRINGKQEYLGTFTTKLEAYKAYCDACIKHHGEFSKIK